MGLTETRNSIIDKINLLSDHELLLKLDSVLEKMQEKDVVQLKEKQTEIILAGLKEYSSGKVVSDLLLREEEEKWLKE